ncbi:succinate dehydrogenase, cytochrome b556 subunit [Noviherbaspirillum pedocola]|uniref:Succinate dehydrogenase cytochrome b556 subunit n=1 Tax=Noviherbaspirillum pedocola TaxID=2801341 RepID=A0A934SPW9_9BURK|nr:succinate dehydrogenase, cytochrome b556 subunit [Noviherbaspirillum pedocola]MBK4734430.1 succinate dehydrogenase, cytochrome b556 subunit [Noviherbaspirillum pedocola]MBK4735421.1 succinate dehydrogenase, cytochrome b556 subunit [Noviherbaspirillum pedocola]
MSEAAKKSRPQFSNIHVTQIMKYRMPLAAWVSILHRISGVLMFLLLPFVLYLLEQSLTSESTFATLHGIVAHPITKLIILALSWAYLHHFLAGIRHLFMDVHMFLSKDGSRHSAFSVLAVSLVLTLVVALKLFGAF